MSLIIYTIKSGDTLSGIANKFTKDFNRWFDLIQVNSNLSKNLGALTSLNNLAGQLLILPNTWISKSNILSQSSQGQLGQQKQSNKNWPRRVFVSSVKPYGYSQKLLSQLMKDDYPDNIIVRMYFGKVCDGTLSEKQFRDRLAELWGANPNYNIGSLAAARDPNKISYIMTVPANAVINIPGSWPEIPGCAVGSQQTCGNFLNCKIQIQSGNISGVLSASNVQHCDARHFCNVGFRCQNGTCIPNKAARIAVAYNDLVRRPTYNAKTFGIGEDLGIVGYPENAINTVGSSEDIINTSQQLLPKEETKTEFPWQWAVLGGVVFLGGLITIVAIKKKAEIEQDQSHLPEPTLEESKKLAVASY